MTHLENGMLVEHVSLGLGKIVALEPKAVHVFFASSDGRFATKLRLPIATSMLNPSASHDVRLSGLAAFTLDATTGRYGTSFAWLTHEEAVARFRERYPEGFQDPAYAGGADDDGGRVRLWRSAHEAWEETLGRGEGERLLASDDLDALVKRAAAVEKHVRALHKESDRPWLGRALADGARARAYFEALLSLVQAPAPDRAHFDALATAVAACGPQGTGESAWPAVTLLPFVARPDVHMVLRPRPTCDGARRLGLELAYEASPSWSAYASLLRCTGALLEKLRPLGARDHADVEVFVHAVTAKHPRAKVAARGASAPTGSNGRM